MPILQGGIVYLVPSYHANYTYKYAYNYIAMLLIAHAFHVYAMLLYIAIYNNYRAF